MTREHKLALIVGFSLILLVGVLISDHLSRARQVRIGQVASGETRVADASVPPAVDPLRNLESLTPEPTAALPNAGSAASGTAGHPAPLVTGGASVATAAGPATADPAPIASAADSLGDAIRQDPEFAGAADAGDEALIRRIVNGGGSIDRDRDGNIIFKLPEAAATTLAGSRPTSSAADQSIAPRFATSPIPMAPAPAASSALETVRLHAVQKGETLFQIAGKYYGTGHAWRELAKFNNVKDKDGVVRVGMRLKIPSRDALLGRVAATDQKPTPGTPAAKPAATKRSEPIPLRSVRTELASYTVKRGESLGLIARKTLGTSKRWPEIADLNRIEDEDHVPAGTILKIPAMRG